MMLFDTGSIGVDTVRVRGPVQRDALGLLPLQRHRDDVDKEGVVRTTATSSEDVTAGGLPYKVDVWRGRPEAVVELSVPRLADGGNGIPAPTAAVLAALTDVYNDIGQKVAWLCDLHDLDVLRLDIARTFVDPDDDGERLGAFLLAMSKVRPERARSVVHPDRAHLGVQNVERKTERWETRLYRRAEHYQDRAVGRDGAALIVLEALAASEKGRLRYEAQLRSRHLAEHGLRTLGKLTDEGMEEAARYLFRRSRFDRRVGRAQGGLRAAADRLRAEGRYKDLGPVGGLLAVRGAGLPPTGNAGTTRKWAKLADELGLTAADLLSDSIGPMRLDWRQGRLLVGDDALTEPGPAAVRLMRPPIARARPSDNVSLGPEAAVEGRLLMRRTRPDPRRRTDRSGARRSGDSPRPARSRQRP